MTREFGPMFSALTDIETLNKMARALEKSESRRLDTHPTNVRKSIARRLGITKDTLENFLYGRTKVVPHWLMDSVRAELVSSLQLEAQNLAHEIQLYRQTGSHPSSDALIAAETQLAAAREILAGELK